MNSLAIPMWLLIPLLLLICSRPALANDPVNIGVEIHTGWSNFSNPNSDPTLDSHPMLGLGVEAQRGRLSLELSADWIDTEVQQTFTEAFGILPILIVGNVVTLKGNLTIVPILLTGRLHLGVDKGKIDPYIGGGGGYYFLSYDPDSPAISFAGDVSNDIDYHSTGGLHANLGLNIRVTPGLTFTIDARYVWAKANITYKGNLSSFTSMPNSLRLDGWVSTFGLKYYFNN